MAESLRLELLSQLLVSAFGRIVTKHFSAFRFDVEDGISGGAPSRSPSPAKQRRSFAVCSAAPERGCRSLRSCRRSGPTRTSSPITSKSSSGKSVRLLVTIPENPNSSGQHRGAAIRSSPRCRKHARRALRALERGARADFVNRGPELAALADALDAVRASARRFVLISGEHGAGKSALCDAFVRTAHAGGPVRVCHGQSFDRELPHEPYYVFLDALIALDRRHPGMVPRTCRERAILAGAVPAVERRGNACGSCGADVRRVGRRACRAVLDLPLILILEDLQWADADSVNALARLAESQIPSKLLIVGTCCDGDWTAGERAHERLLSVGAASPRSAMLLLGSLTLEHVARYVDARFGPECLSELARPFIRRPVAIPS